MKITEEQLKVLATLKCERLSSDDNNLRLVEEFFNNKESLSNTLKNEAYEDDEAGNIVYYLIKDSENNILFYFSLKCGVLYDKYINGELYQQLKGVLDNLIQLSLDEKTSEADKKIIYTILCDVRNRKGIAKKSLSSISRKNTTIEEFEKMMGDNTEKVGATFAGIEIVQFCRNEENNKWSSCGIDKKLGVIVFWNFIVPIVLKVREYVGCQYLFLFAADESEDENLVNYYKYWLKFKQDENLKTAMPLYDLKCKFLYQEAGSLAEKREKFFNNFNPDEDDV